MTRWLIDGAASLAIAPDDRGLAYGDGLFETIAVRGSECRFLGAHLQRLALGCQRLGIPYPGDELFLHDIDMLGSCAHGSLKLIVTRGRGPRGYRPPPIARPTRMVGLEAAAPVAAPARVRVRYCSTALGRNRSLAGLKTLNRLENVLARGEWSDPSVHEGLLLNDRDEVVCGTMSNLFLQLQNELHTPDLSESGVNGVMRAQVIRLAEANDIVVKESRVSRADLAAAEDVFLTNSLIGVWPVDELDGNVFQRSEMTLRVMQLLAEGGVSECAP